MKTIKLMLSFFFLFSVGLSYGQEEAIPTPNGEGAIHISFFDDATVISTVNAEYIYTNQYTEINSNLVYFPLGYG